MFWAETAFALTSVGHFLLKCFLFSILQTVLVFVVFFFFSSSFYYKQKFCIGFAQISSLLVSVKLRCILSPPPVQPDGGAHPPPLLPLLGGVHLLPLHLLSCSSTPLHLPTCSPAPHHRGAAVHLRCVPPQHPHKGGLPTLRQVCQLDFLCSIY